MSGFIGILSLDSRFPRIPGDAGNPDSYDLPARLRVVEGADSPKIVRDGRPDPALAASFIAAAQQLEAEGAAVITSTCGFLISMQEEIAASVAVPVLLSGLGVIAPLDAMRPGQVFGILTASAESLGHNALKSVGISRDRLRIAGLADRPLFARCFLSPKDRQPTHFDPAQMQAEVTSAARALIAAHPEITRIVLECGNLPPYADAIARETGRPVSSVIDGVNALAKRA